MTIRVNLSGKYIYYRHKHPTTQLKICEAKMDRIKGEIDNSIIRHLNTIPHSQSVNVIN